MSQPIVTLDESTPGQPRLVVEMPAEQQEAIRTALATLNRTGNGSRIQRIVSEALLAAVEQQYFWTPEWQAKEREADEAIAEGRVRTFDTMDDMIDFLDEQ
jgi:hypothetical protein